MTVTYTLLLVLTFFKGLRISIRRTGRDRSGVTNNGQNQKE